MLDDYSDIMTVREAMEALGVSRSTMYLLIENRKIPAFRLGQKLWRVRKDDLLKYLDEQ
jgi:excisionase family DNA binding protein